MAINELLEKSKAPTSKKRYVGIEIEFLLPRDKDLSLEKLLYKHELQWNVNLGGDGSVSDTAFIPIYAMRPSPFHTNVREQYVVNYADKKQGHEMRILAEEDEAPAIVIKCLEVIKQCGGIVNETCGLHVHIDLRSRDYNKVYHNLFHVQDLMFATQPPSRRKNEFCRKLPRMFKSKNIERYYAINKMSYDEHRTIEVRLHEPTLKHTDILMWVGFLIKIANMDVMLDKKIKTVEELDWLPESLKGHLNERIKKYSGKRNPQTA